MLRAKEQNLAHILHHNRVIHIMDGVGPLECSPPCLMLDQLDDAATVRLFQFQSAEEAALIVLRDLPALARELLGQHWLFVDISRPTSACMTKC